MPPLRTATDVTIGRPSSCDIRSMSIVTPRRFAISIMLSTSIIGRPTRFSSSTSRKVSRRLVASATQSTRSGTASPSKRPSTMSRVISSSGLRPRNE